MCPTPTVDSQTAGTPASPLQETKHLPSATGSPRPLSQPRKPLGPYPEYPGPPIFPSGPSDISGHEPVPSRNLARGISRRQHMYRPSHDRGRVLSRVDIASHLTCPPRRPTLNGSDSFHSYPSVPSLRTHGSFIIFHYGTRTKMGNFVFDEKNPMVFHTGGGPCQGFQARGPKEEDYLFPGTSEDSVTDPLRDLRTTRRPVYLLEGVPPVRTTQGPLTRHTEDGYQCISLSLGST